ncbi:hypothetical protein K9L04_00815 [Patescibacteria group bacterium]|nr:hypothetical protein [Patescibacteria group bacterium]
MFEYHEKFKEYFNIKEEPSNNEEILYKKVLKYTKPLSRIPFIKGIFVCNSLSMNATNKNSDIDLFIVSSNNRLWIVRILTTLYFQLLGNRRTSNKIKNNFCLSFFCTENGISNFNKIKIENDIYLFFWIYYLKTIVDKNDIYKKLLNLFNIEKQNKDFNKYKIYIKYKNNIKNYKFFDFFEYLLKKIFIKKTINHKKKLENPWGVIINNDMLKFHDNDVRRKVRNEIINDK